MSVCASERRETHAASRHSWQRSARGACQEILHEGGAYVALAAVCKVDERVRAASYRVASYHLETRAKNARSAC